jgi:hypothetical protein
MPKRRNFMDEYLGEIITYGGVPYTRGAVIADMQSQGLDQACIDRWLQGQEHSARLRARELQREHQPAKQ